jgi:hypothetical protein
VGVGTVPHPAIHTRGSRRLPAAARSPSRAASGSRVASQSSSASKSLLPGRILDSGHSFPAVSTGQGFEIVVAAAFPPVPRHAKRWAANARSSFSPVATIFSAPSGSGRCSASASSHGARSQTSCSSVVVMITGIAFGCTRAASAFGSQVRDAKMSVVTSPSFALRTLVQFVQRPAKARRGRLPSR